MNGATDRDVLHERALVLAKPRTVEARTGARLHLFQFLLQNEVCGIETKYVREVFAMRHYTRVPCTPDFIMGVTSLHGEVLPLIDLGRLFDRPRMAITNLNKVVVIDAPPALVGIVVDEPRGIEEHFLDDLNEMPLAAGDGRAPYLRGLSGKGVIVLDMSAIVESGRLIAGGRAENDGSGGGGR